MDFKLVVNKSSTGADWKESLDTEDLIRKELPEVSDSEVEKYLREIGKIWEVFEVRSGEHEWRVTKSHDEVQEFIIEYNLRFKARLVFGSFMMSGVREVFENGAAREWVPFLRFFEWKDLDIGKVKSIKLLKKSGGRYKDYFCCRLPWQWNQRDFVVTKSGVLYYSESKDPKEYLPFGASFRLFKGKKETGYEFGIRLEANHRKLLLYAQSTRDFFQFLYFVGQGQSQALVHAENRFRSFAPVRRGNNVHFIIDGQDYFRAVAQGIERAQCQLMISGWYISPEFQLMRPVSLNREMRLDQLLKRACERGLKVFVLVYNESSFLTNDSAYVKQTFEALSPAIKVLQHPLGVLPTFWSHHEKLVIIDQSEAFLGGLDLGFGRFDDSRHLIDHNDPDFYPGLEYNNVRNTDLTRVREFWRDGVPRDVARLPWHDVGVYLAGEAALDLSHHFIEYWNYASFQTFHQDRYVLVLNLDQPKKPFLHQIREGIAHKFKGIRQFAGALKRRIFSHPDENEAGSESAKAAKAMREEEIRVAVEGTSECRSNQAGKWGAKFDESWYETVLPLPTVPVDSSSKSQESEVALQEGRREGSALQLRRRFTSMKELDEIVETMEDRIGNIDFMDDLQVTRQRNELPEIREEAEDDFSCQILRSVGSWSIGCEPRNKEQSVHSAYLHLIRTARRFIYIENQFFISMTQSSANTVKNEIANEIYLRIATAVAHHEPFKVWVIIPLIPGFAGELDDPEAVIPRVIMHWQFATISRGDHSLMARVAALGVNPADYLQFFGLRTHGMVGGRPQTEIVYVHSKLLIVDDQRAICGSANINERSMRGSRDSEVCLMVEEGPQQMVRGVAVSEELFSLRLRLFHEHFGSDLDASDPAGELLWRQVRERTAKNTALYREIFKCYPDDYIKTLADLTILRGAPPNQEIYERWKDQIVGFAVEYPLQFLKEEDLLVGATLYPDSLSV